MMLRAFGPVRRALSTLVVAEHASGVMSSTTLAAIAAAKLVHSKPIKVLVAGDPVHIKGVSQAVQPVEGVDEVLTAAHDAYSHALAENIANLILHLHINEKYSHIIAPATSFGKDFIPRVAAMLDVAAVSDITHIESSDTFKRPIYAGNVVATVKVEEPVKIFTVRSSAFTAPASGSHKANISIVKLPDNPDLGLTKWVSDEILKSDRPDLIGAKIVLSGGRAFKSKQNFDKLYKLADVMKAAVGASRAAVDAGYCPNDFQVGQTGKVVAPDLYIAFGISGAIQHLAGMKDSKVIVAVNKDKQAPIFQVADYGLVADIFQVMEELQSEFSSSK